MGDLESSVYSDIKEMQQSGKFLIHGGANPEVESLYEELLSLAGNND